MGALALLAGCGGSPELVDADGGSDDGGTGTGGRTTDGGDGDDGPGIDGGGGQTPNPEPEPTSECGNGELEPGEFCDDGNRRDGDGCSADCSTQDPNYDCSEPGRPCVNLVVCGNGRIEGNEACDDGNTTSGDGCTSDCTRVEAGYACARPGVACVLLPVCGNGVRERGEQCDDGGTVSGDGCTGTEQGVVPCQLEDGFFCPQPGQACLELRCGDGVRTPDEECDDGQSPPLNGDGCSSTCRLEPGFRCSGTACGPVCGDGLVVTGEQCDDGNRVSGDGCSGACTREPFYNCSGAPSVCVSTIQCGNGVLEPGEICDPPGVGGCLPGCRSFAPDSGVGSVCGNGVIEPGEACDRPMPGAGCTSGCVVESGWACPMPDTCYRLPYCGDGIVQAGEGCDVGPLSSAGCVGCAVSSGWLCYGNEPSVCEQPLCGDGILTPDEECDDDNQQAGDGCTSCAVDPGWVCPTVGERCIPICGDGVLNGEEECDDGNRVNEDGCNAACRVEPGYACPDVGEACVPSVCGNEEVEPGEGCDDGNRIAGDGCGPTCQLEPQITPGPSPVVHTTCGDGLRTGDEECDDGNTTAGDGCSSECEVEIGFDCSELLDLPEEVEIRTFVRDFKSSVASGGHPDFQYAHLGHVEGIPGQACTTQNAGTCGRLDSAGKPVLQVTNQGQTGIMNAATYGLWFRDGNPNNVTGLNGVIQTQPTFERTLILSQIGGQNSERYEFDATANFFPLGPNEGFGAVGPEAGLCSSQNDGNMNGVRCQVQCQWDGGIPNRACDTGCNNDDCRGRNFGFTTELRYFFQYKGGEELVFRGDDDVWVFINGRLAVDIGGLHQARYGRVILGDDGVLNGGVREGDSDCSVHGRHNIGEGSEVAVPPACSLSPAEAADNRDDRFNLVRGGVYEIVLFHAERHTTASNFRLTLSGFIAPRSYCEPICGDGTVAGWEVCDDGEDNSDTVYGACNTSCTGRTFCGDGVRQGPGDSPAGPEACDNGRNLDIRASGNANECAPGCRTPSRCGDGVVQAAFEMCDNGAGNSDSAYGVGSCTTSCSFGGYCGDGVVNGGEICDFAAPGNVAYGPESCGYNCARGPFCGDGVRNGPEECDGTPNCDSECRLMPFCGDGVLSAGESCDYAQFASDEYGGCTASCEWGPRCGDGEQQSPYEECDEGSSNSDDEYGGCTTSCNLGPRCGDRVVQSDQGEACDNGFNDDAYEYTSTSCGEGCTRPPHCGDGDVQAAFEQCDEGANNSDSAYEGCTTSCTWGPYCGDGTRNGAERCDDGANNVLYRAEQGACGYDCEPAPYCGDGVRNGPEQCDVPAAEGGNTGAYGGCKADCTWAPRCGDGVVQKDEGEQCDDGPIGSLRCTSTCRARAVVPR